MREIGDVVFTTPAIHALRRHFPDAHLTYIVEPAAAPVVSHNPHINQVVIAPRIRGVRGVAADFALGRRLRADGYDLAIDFHGGPRASLLTWLSGAPDRLGYDVAGRSWMYTRRVARPRVLRPRHSVENQWDLLTALGIAAPDRAACPVEMAPDPDAVASVDARLAQAGVRGGGRQDALVVIHVSAGNPFRRWPIEHFITLVAALASDNPTRSVIVTSGPSERDARERVVREARIAAGSGKTRAAGPDVGRVLSDPPDRILSCGEFTLAELRALLDRAALFIGGDSGPMHIAATTRVPIVGLYGPTLPARSTPWRMVTLVSESVDAGDLPCRPCDQRVCEPGDFRCLTRISPEQVAQAARRALATTAPDSATLQTLSR